MQKKVDAHIFAGMQKDMAISKHKNEFLYDAYNIRFTPMEGNTMMSITNERGPKYQCACEGKYVGHCVVDKYLILFTKKIDGTDRIVKFEPNTSNTETILYEGNLNFQLNHPLETLGVYENENIIKVYWVDGVNQPRVINIVRDANSEHPYITGLDTQFDFTPTLQLRESISVERIDGAGMFAPGVIQYAFSYYNLFGQQSNIFYTTSLNYISFTDRGGSGDDKCANSFRITINNVDTNFDYLRIYAIQRTSLNGQATGRRVVDIKINSSTASVNIVDNGEIGDAIDSQELLYIGGDMVAANTLATKSNALFLGSYKLLREEPFPYLTKFEDDCTITPYIQSKIIFREDEPKGYYFYTNQLKNLSSGFKNREHYRLGLQLQHKSGKWSTPYYISDEQVVSTNNPSLVEESNRVICNTIALDCTLDFSDYLQQAQEKGYVKIRPVVVFPSFTDRLVLTQGLLCPTVFNYRDRTNNIKYSIPSWFFRLNPPEDIESAPYYKEDTDFGGAWLEFRHLHTLRPFNTYGGEVMGMRPEHYKFVTDGLPKDNSFDGSVRPRSSTALPAVYAVDQSLLTMHSPEIEFDNTDLFKSLQDINWKLRLVGIANFTAVKSDSDITASTPPAKGIGFIKYDKGFHDTKNNIKGLVAGSLWSDAIVYKNDQDEYSYGKNARYIIYPWHKSGALNNDENRPASAGQTTAMLSKKTVANLRFSKNNTWFSNTNGSTFNYDITRIDRFSSKEYEAIGISNQDESRKSRRMYFGNEDSIIAWTQSDFKIPVVGKDSGEISSIAESVVGAVTEGKDIVNVEEIAIRMSYKSTPHLVFGLHTKGGNDEEEMHRPVILPSVNNLNRADPEINSIPDWYYSEFSNIINGDESNYGIIDYSMQARNTGTSGFEGWVSSDAAKLIFEEDPTSYDYSVWIYFQDNVGTVVGRDYHLYYIKRDVQPGTGGADDTIVWTAYSLFTDTEAHRYQKYVLRSNTQWQVYEVTNYTDSIVHFVSYMYPENADIPESDLKSRYKVFQDNIPNINLEYPYLFLGELYREATPATDFGGPIEQSYLSNMWLPAGEPVPLSNTIHLLFTEGDTWYQRYDCLKTYPFTEEHANNIIEVGSFLCESRINTDGIYSKKRGQYPELLSFTPNNQNQLNEVYDQQNNFFNYNMLHESMFNLDEFPNQLFYTLEKFSGSEIDNWTTLNLTSTHDVDGTKGAISALRLFRDNLLCFQDKAISQIMYDSRVQIPSSDGVPIEITNSKKLDGSRIISDSIGCSNKWSICTTPNALYFMDSNSKKLYAFSDKLQTISDTHGFDHHFKSIENFDSEHTFYDPIRQDVYLVWDSQCLVWSELLGQFTSFMSYENVPAMFNIGDKFYSIYFSREWNSNTSTNGYVQHDSFINLYEMFKGGYNRFFGIIYPSHITFVSNPDGSTDKIFSTLGARLDVFRENPESTEAFKNLQHKRFFDYIQVSNEYQDTGKVPLAQSWIKPASHGTSLYNVKKKFRQWRIDIPRDTLDSEHRLNRIRNTWAKISLGFDPPVNPHILTQEELLAYASANNIENFDIAAYYEQIPNNPLEHATSERSEQEAPLSPEVEAAIAEYKKMHYILHDVDVQYFV